MVIQKKRILLLLYAAILCSLLVAFPAKAEKTETSKTEIIFLLDTSLSMKDQDVNYLAVDAIKQMIHSMPSSYKCGVISYGTQVETVIPLGVDMMAIEETLAAISYGGYTNAGAGLHQAVDLFSEDDSVERYIIMLSDGEIDMPDQQSKERSRQLYAEAAMRAKARNIKIYIIAVGSELIPAMHIFDGAELTDGAIYWQGHSGSLSNIMGRIVSERFTYPVSELEPSGLDKLNAYSLTEYKAQPKVPAIKQVIDVSQPEVLIKTLDYQPLYIVLASLAAAIAVLTLSYSFISPRKAVSVSVPQPMRAKPPRAAGKAVMAAYSGKLSIYMRKMPAGQDIPPQTFRLFGKSAEWMNLTQILEPCGVRISRSKTDQIKFFPGPEHSLIVMDHSSECIVYRGVEVLHKGVEYPVSYSAKITVAFDVETELEIHYESLDKNKIPQKIRRIT